MNHKDQLIRLESSQMYAHNRLKMSTKIVSIFNHFLCLNLDFYSDEKFVKQIYAVRINKIFHLSS